MIIEHQLESITALKTHSSANLSFKRDNNGEREGREQRSLRRQPRVYKDFPPPRRMVHRPTWNIGKESAAKMEQTELMRLPCLGPPVYETVTNRHRWPWYWLLGMCLSSPASANRIGPGDSSRGLQG